MHALEVAHQSSPRCRGHVDCCSFSLSNQLLLTARYSCLVSRLPLAGMCKVGEMLDLKVGEYVCLFAVEVEDAVWECRVRLM